MASNDGLFSRLALDRLLGPGLFRITDNSASGQRRDVVFGCGCLAREHDPDRFEVFACPDHRSGVAAERDHRATRAPIP